MVSARANLRATGGRDRRRWPRWLLGGLAALAVGTLLIGLGLYGLARQAEPSYAGRVALKGLQAPVSVTFGAHAVPHARATAVRDLFFAQGYLVARERLWQMDLLRRMARGRLAEVLGPAALPVDRLFRVVGLGTAAQASLAALDAEVAAYVQAYADGVNAYREEAQDRLPVEYRLAGFSPQRWEPVDSLAIVEYMSFLLSFNARHELTFLKLAARIGLDRARELFPVDEGEPAPPFPPEIREVLGSIGPTAGELAARLAAAAREGAAAGGASNSWAVAGERTRSGLPLLANDPHLVPVLPSVWYELELEGPGYHAYGLSLPGVPFFLIGHNEDLAWGLTTAMSDTQDVVLERSVPGIAAVERASGLPEPLGERTETIAVRGRAEPESVRVRSTREGVVLNDVLDRPAGTPHDFPVFSSPYLVVLRSTLTLPDTALAGLYRMNRAATVEDLLAGARLVRRASQNVMYAHRDGRVGSYVTGALPVRRQGRGAFPEPGWVEGYGWQGLLPAEANPSVCGAGPAGVLVAANDRLVPREAALQPSSVWMPPYRGFRIRELLAASSRPGPTELAAMQGDVVSVEARRYSQAVQRVGPELQTRDPTAWAIAQRFLLGWDHATRADSPSAAFLVLLRPRFAAALLGDELGPDLADLLRISAVAYNPLQEVVYSGQSAFWDDLRTPAVETPADIWARALRATEAEIRRIVGDPVRLRLDRVKQLTFPHAFHWLPLLGPAFDVGPLSVGGDDHTVSVMKAPLTEPGQVQFVPSYRVVFTPGEGGSSRGTNTLGQSGHRFSPYRADQLSDWLGGGGHLWRWGGPPADEVIGVLELTPP